LRAAGKDRLINQKANVSYLLLSLLTRKYIIKEIIDIFGIILTAIIFILLFPKHIMLLLEKL
jgi:hypothetical protein